MRSSFIAFVFWGVVNAVIIGEIISYQDDPVGPYEYFILYERIITNYLFKKKTIEWVSTHFCNLGNGVAINPLPDVKGGKSNQAIARRQFSDDGIQEYYTAYRRFPFTVKFDPVAASSSRASSHEIA